MYINDRKGAGGGGAENNVEKKTLILTDRKLIKGGVGIRIS